MLNSKDQIYCGIFEFYKDCVGLIHPPYQTSIRAYRQEAPVRFFKYIMKYFFIMPNRFSSHEYHLSYGIPLFRDMAEDEWRIPITPFNSTEELAKRFRQKYHIIIPRYFTLNSTGVISLRTKYWQILTLEWFRKGGLWSWQEVKSVLEKPETPAWKIVELTPKVENKKLLLKRKHGNQGVPAVHRRDNTY